MTVEIRKVENNEEDTKCSGLGKEGKPSTKRKRNESECETGRTAEESMESRGGRTFHLADSPSLKALLRRYSLGVVGERNLCLLVRSLVCRRCGS